MPQLAGQSILGVGSGDESEVVVGSEVVGDVDGEVVGSDVVGDTDGEPVGYVVGELVGAHVIAQHTAPHDSMKFVAPQQYV